MPITADELTTHLQRHRPAMLALATRYLGHAERAEDAVQEACVAIFVRAADFEVPADASDLTIRAWMLRITYHQAQHAARSHVRRRLQALPPNAVGLVEDDPGAALLMNDRHEVLHRAMRQLSVSDQELLVLRYWGGCTSADIAALLRRPAISISVALHRARQRLRRRLQQNGGIQKLLSLGPLLPAGDRALAADLSLTKLIPGVLVMSSAVIGVSLALPIIIAAQLSAAASPRPGGEPAALLPEASHDAPPPAQPITDPATIKDFENSLDSYWQAFSVAERTPSYKRLCRVFVTAANVYNKALIAHSGTVETFRETPDGLRLTTALEEAHNNAREHCTRLMLQQPGSAPAVALIHDRCDALGLGYPSLGSTDDGARSIANHKKWQLRSLLNQPRRPSGDAVISIEPGRGGGIRLGGK